MFYVNHKFNKKYRLCVGTMIKGNVLMLVYDKEKGVYHLFTKMAEDNCPVYSTNSRMKAERAMDFLIKRGQGDWTNWDVVLNTVPSF